MLYLFIHLLDPSSLYIACARHCAQCWGYSEEQKIYSLSSGAHCIVGKTGSYQTRKKRHW